MMIPIIQHDVFERSVFILELIDSDPADRKLKYIELLLVMAERNTALAAVIGSIGLTGSAAFAEGMIMMYKIIEDQMIANATRDLESLVK